MVRSIALMLMKLNFRFRNEFFYPILYKQLTIETKCLDIYKVRNLFSWMLVRKSCITVLGAYLGQLG